MSFPGGMTPGQALGGGLTQTNPDTGLPYGQTQQAPGPYTGIGIGNGFKFTELDPVTGQPLPQGPKPGDQLAQPVDSPRVMDPFGGMTPGNALGGGLTMPQPQQQPQQFPNLMQNPAFNPAVQAPQQMQQIAQGQPTLVNQLAPPPAQGPVPGQSITQVPPPFPSAQPAPQPAPQPLMPPVAQAQPQPLMPPQPMPTQATQGYQSRIQPRPAPQPVRAAPPRRPAPQPVRKPLSRPAPVRTR